jgi:hypothetical protein
MIWIAILIIIAVAVVASIQYSKKDDDYWDGFGGGMEG